MTDTTTHWHSRKCRTHTHTHTHTPTHSHTHTETHVTQLFKQTPTHTCKTSNDVFIIQLNQNGCS